MCFVLATTVSSNIFLKHVKICAAKSGLSRVREAAKQDVSIEDEKEKKKMRKNLCR